ncbi:MAG: hypothetical protein FJX29_14670 [Alphaproteobacteria bacterium]|nr:hypothetical protein [Alphaproteobacteria bacterium]
MKPTLHPLVVLIGVLVIGIGIWPLLQKSGSVPKNTLADGLAVIVLIGGYYLYKRWYDQEKGSAGKQDGDGQNGGSGKA